jgi:hypothetical protein
MTCEGTLLTQIRHEINHRAPNKSRYPICFGEHIDEYGVSTWLVTIELDSSAGTFDIETMDPNPILALTKALHATRRAYSPKQ